MNAIRKTDRLLLGAALMVGCTERNAQTGPASPATGPILADVAAGKTSVVDDGQYDWVDKVGQDYQDIHRCEITKQGKNFVFAMTLYAQTVPSNPPVPSWADMLDWVVALDAVPVEPAGYPFTKNTVARWDYVLEHRAYRSGFSDPFDQSDGGGILTDRINGKVLTVQFSINGGTLTWVADAALLGDPPTFQWACGARALAAHAGDDVKNGYNNNQAFDVAPNTDQGAPLITWPQ